ADSSVRALCGSAIMAVFLMWLFGTVLGLPVPIHVPTLLSKWTGVVIGTTCLLQVAVGMLLDSRVEKGLFRNYFWMIWYPLAFWLINVFTTVVSVPRALFRSTGKRARWKSPDRGLLPDH